MDIIINKVAPSHTGCVAPQAWTLETDKFGWFRRFRRVGVKWTTQEAASSRLFDARVIAIPRVTLIEIGEKCCYFVVDYYTLI
jgi:hypothetical protein